MSEETTLILHRKSANRPEVKAAVKAVRKSGIPLKVRIPWNKKEKANVVVDALVAGATRIIAGGGDGTINAVASALVGDGSKPPPAELGILPLGTANDFATGCGLPTDDLSECLKIACSGKPEPIDVGMMNGRPFINVASLGFGAEVTASTPQDMKKALGGGAYTLMGLATALKFQPYQGVLHVEGEDDLEGQMLIAAVGNSRLAGGGFEVAPKAELDDGLLDLAYIGSDEEFSVATVLRELKTPFDPENRYVRYRQLDQFTLESETKLHCNLDGEPVLKKRMTFSVIPKFLNLVKSS